MRVLALQHRAPAVAVGADDFATHALLFLPLLPAVCGDGVCEDPFEFAAYSRFGCRADCGRLQDIQNLTAIQIDLQFDFSHPAGSIPATVRPPASSRVD